MIFGETFIIHISVEKGVVVVVIGGSHEVVVAVPTETTLLVCFHFFLKSKRPHDLFVFMGM